MSEFVIDIRSKATTRDGSSLVDICYQGLHRRRTQLKGINKLAGDVSEHTPKTNDPQWLVNTFTCMFVFML